MTKREHMVEVPLEEFDEDLIPLIEELEKEGHVTVSVALQNYLDASTYGWTEYLHEPEINARYHVRAMLLKMIDDIDDDIDDLIEAKEKKE